MNKTRFYYNIIIQRSILSSKERKYLKKLQPSMKTKRKIVRARPLFNVVKAFLARLQEHALTAFSAQSAFFIIISFFPFAMLLLTLLEYIPLPISKTTDFIVGILPHSINDYVVSILGEIHTKASGALISITAVTALWSASKGMLAMTRGMNSVYGITEKRNYVKLRIMAVVHTLIFIVILLAMLVVMVFGNALHKWIAKYIPVIADVIAKIIDLRGIGGFALLVVFFTVLYIFLPDRRSNFFKELPGAIFSAVGWIAFSFLYAFYIDNIANYSYLYGSLTAIVLLMLWLYICMYILFLGGEINCLLAEKNLIRRLKDRKKNHKKL